MEIVTMKQFRELTKDVPDNFLLVLWDGGNNENPTIELDEQGTAVHIYHSDENIR